MKMTKKYEVYQRRLDKINFFPLKEEEIRLEDYEKTYEYETESLPIEENLEAIFALLNRDDRPTRETTYSLSMNDLIKVDDDYYLCAMVGWKKIQPLEYL